MNNLTLRILTSIIGAAVMIAGILWNETSLLLLLFLLSTAVHIEYLLTIQNLKEDKRNYFEWAWCLLSGFLLFFLFIRTEIQSRDVQISFLTNATTPLFPGFSILFILFPGFVLIELFNKRNNPFQNIGLNLTGLMYCILPFALLYLAAVQVDRNSISEHFDHSMSSISQNSNFKGLFILGYFLIIWSNDVFAYVFGRLMGKHKLIERISPKKTWEGFAGGAISALACAAVLGYFFEFLSATDWLVIGLIVPVFGTMGDLVESMLKRSVQIKDSSSILPGHGGFLDRFDATLLAAPVIFVYLMIRL